MSSDIFRNDGGRRIVGGRHMVGVKLLIAGLLVLAVAGAFFAYTACRIEVDTGEMAILIRKTGLDLGNSEEIAPTDEHKGLQRHVLAEGRHFYNPWKWDWEVTKQVEVPQGKLGVRVRLYGDDLPYGEIIAHEESQKGIVPEVLRPGRYAINALVEAEPRRRDSYAEFIELHEPVVIPAGFKGVVTNLAGKMPDDPNVLLVEPGMRGVQEAPLDEGTYYINPYTTRIDLVDCRSQRFNLGYEDEMGFPSKDGFWVTLDGIIEFRVRPERAAQVLVVYNEVRNDSARNARVDEEIVKKVILPNARSFCRLRGSDHAGKDFISGQTRTKFQQDFQKQMETACDSQGIQIVQALITRINPPEKIAEPVRQRQIATQQELQYKKEIQQQGSEKQLAVQNEMIKRKQALIAAEQRVIKITTDAKREQEVAMIEARQQLKVAELELQASADQAAAILARGQAVASVLEFKNEAEASGWTKAVNAFDGRGAEFARYVLLKKLAPAFRQMMVNTADSPIMDIFREYQSVDMAKTPNSGGTPPSEAPPIEAAAKVAAPAATTPGVAKQNN